MINMKKKVKQGREVVSVWDKGEVAMSDKVASERPHLEGDIRLKDLK